jgi:hypothetical protein
MSSTLTSALIISIILDLFPYMSGNNRACIEQNRAHIEAQLDEAFARYPDVPREVLAAVAFAETHLGCDKGEGGNWGAPISRNRRHTAGTHLHAAGALHRSLAVCGNIDGAIMRFRVGLCNPRRQTTNTLVRIRAANYLRTIQRLQTAIMRRAAAFNETNEGNSFTP